MNSTTTINDEIRNAFSLLMDHAFVPTFEYINNINPGIIKNAYRKKAFEFHPDRAAVLGKNQIEMNETFKEINIAYETVCSFLKKNRPSFSTSTAAAGRPYYGYNKTDYKTKTDTSKKRTDRGHTSNTAFSEKSAGHKGWGSSHYSQEESYNLPNIELMIGQFLYICRVISWKALIESIVWQRNQRPLFGEIAKKWNILSDEEIKKIIANKNAGDKIGDFAYRNGYITLFEHLAIIGKQRSLQRPIGEYLINNNYVSQDTMEEMVLRQRRHNIRVKFGVDFMF